MSWAVDSVINLTKATIPSAINQPMHAVRVPNIAVFVLRKPDESSIHRVKHAIQLLRNEESGRDIADVISYRRESDHVGQ